MGMSLPVLPVAPFSIGDVLKDTCKVLRLNFASFLLASIIIRLLWLLAPDGVRSENFDPAHIDWVAEFGGPLIGYLVFYLTLLAVVPGTLMALRGENSSVGDLTRALPSV